MPKVDNSLYIEIGKILKQERRKRKISLDRLVKMLGGEKTKSTLKRYEDGASRMETETLANICDKLDINYDDVVATAKSRSIAKSEGFNIIYTDSTTNNYERFKMPDDSMKNIGIIKNDIIFYYNDIGPVNNSLVVIELENKKTLRRYTEYDNLVVLKSENVNYQDIILKDENIKILGIAIAFQRILLK